MSRHSLVFLILIWYYRPIHCECPSDRKMPENIAKVLRDNLFCAYNSHYRPVRNYKNAVNVEVQIILNYITFDATEEIFTIHGMLHMTWQDEFLMWDPKDYGDIKEINLESHEIWTPRLALLSAGPTILQSDQHFDNCFLKSNGTTSCVAHVPFDGLCQTWLQDWPYDKQNCTFYFGSWMHTGEQINFTFPKSNEALIYESSISAPGWKLLGVVSQRMPVKYAFSNDTYPRLKYTFMLQRDSPGLHAIIAVPSALLVILTIVTLLLDLKDDTRMGLQCFSLFGHFMVMGEVGFNLPKQSLYAPLILVFICDSMVITTSSILMSLLLASILSRVNEAPGWLVKLTKLLTTGPGKYVVSVDFNSSDTKKLPEGDINEESENYSRHTNTWRTLANLLNSVVFIVYIVVYLILFKDYMSEQS